MLTSMTISPLSPRARHGAVCSENGMSVAFRQTGQICAFVCPSPQSSLTTGPRFVETPAMTTLGGYVTGKRGQVCVVPKLSAPQGEKFAHRLGRSFAWGVWKMPTTEQGRWRTHVSGGRHTTLLDNKLSFSSLNNLTIYLTPNNLKIACDEQPHQCPKGDRTIADDDVA